MLNALKKKNLYIQVSVCVHYLVMGLANTCGLMHIICEYHIVSRMPTHYVQNPFSITSTSGNDTQSMDTSTTDS